MRCFIFLNFFFLSLILAASTCNSSSLSSCSRLTGALRNQSHFPVQERKLWYRRAPALHPCHTSAPWFISGFEVPWGLIQTTHMLPNLIAKRNEVSGSATPTHPADSYLTQINPKPFPRSFSCTFKPSISKVRLKILPWCCLMFNKLLVALVVQTLGRSGIPAPTSGLRD